MTATTSLSLLRNIEIGKIFDMICKVRNSAKYANTTHSHASCEHKLKDSFSLVVAQVLHVRESSEGECVLFIWDGTDVPPTTFQTK